MSSALIYKYLQCISEQWLNNLVLVIFTPDNETMHATIYKSHFGKTTLFKKWQDTMLMDSLKNFSLNGQNFEWIIRLFHIFAMKGGIIWITVRKRLRNFLFLAYRPF